MAADLQKRQFVKKAILATGALGVIPALDLRALSRTGLPGIYSSIPEGFPILGHLYKSFFQNSGLISVGFGGEVPHPNALLNENFFRSNHEIAILSTLGSHLSSLDPRLSFIENIPLIGKQGSQVMNWLSREGERYWNSCASDWGYRVIPTMIVSSTNFGWMSAASETISYPNVVHRTRGVLEDFLRSQGAQKAPSVESLFATLNDDSKINFLQMVNDDIDVQWEPRVLNLNRVGGPSESSGSALLLGLMIPQNCWQNMSASAKQKLQGLCRQSLKESYMLTSNALPTAQNDDTGVSPIVRDYMEFARNRISKLTGARSNAPLKRLLG